MDNEESVAPDSNSTPPAGERKDKPWLFKKGDPRINRKGRPKNAMELAKLARQIVREPVFSKDGKEAKTRLELIMLDWVTSRDFRKQQAVIEAGYGKAVSAVQLSGPGGGPIQTLELSKLPDEKLNAMLRAAGLSELPNDEK